MSHLLSSTLHRPGAGWVLAARLARTQGDYAFASMATRRALSAVMTERSMTDAQRAARERLLSTYAPASAAPSMGVRLSTVA